MVSIPSRFQGRARRDAAAFYLSQLARGILAGELGVLSGGETVPIQPADYLVLDIAVGVRGRANQVSVRVRWPRSGPAPRRRARAARGRRPPTGHPQFTDPSPARNADARDSPADAHHQ